MLLVSGLKKVSSAISNLLNAPRTALDTSLSSDVDSSVFYKFEINNKLENPFNSHYSLNRVTAFFAKAPCIGRFCQGKRVMQFEKKKRQLRRK